MEPWLLAQFLAADGKQLHLDVHNAGAAAVSLALRRRKRCWFQAKQRSVVGSRIAAADA